MQILLCLLQICILVFACTFKFSETCECGRSPSGRIYDGYTVSSREFPWMARLYSLEGEKIRKCGATMISTLYAVTAGHCTPKSTSAKSYLFFGSRSFDSVFYSESPNVEKFIVKSRASNGEDIALVKLRKNVNVVPICLPPTDESFADVRATMLGYGRTESGQGSKYLLAGNVIVPSNKECGRVENVLSTEICAGNYGGGPAICAGDSGGPLMYYDEGSNRWILIGVASASYGCSNTKKFGYFTRVSSFVSGIQQYSNNAGCQA